MTIVVTHPVHAHQFIRELWNFLGLLLLLLSGLSQILGEGIPASLVEAVNRFSTAFNFGNPLYSVRSLIRGNK